MSEPILAYCNKCQRALRCEGCSSFAKRLQDAEAKCVELHGAHGHLKEQLKTLRQENENNEQAVMKALDSLIKTVNQRDALVRALQNIVQSRGGEFRDIARDTLDTIANELKAN